jgi:predicted nucleic acid-binding protein
MPRPAQAPAMEGLRLRDGVSFCRVRDRYVFLDVARDRYFTLEGSAANVFEKVVRGSISIDARERERLIETGLVEASGTRHMLSPTSVTAPMGSLLDEPGDRPRLDPLIFAEITTLLASMARRRGRTPLSELLARLARPEPPTAKGDVLSQTRRFNAARAWAPVKPHCLSDSLALTAFLRRRGATAEVVFGVKLTPFAAHAWVQKHDLVLNDHVDRIREYTPVLVV